jgi:internalin A
MDVVQHMDVSRRIQEAIETELKSLDLSNAGVTQLPVEIGQAKGLKGLYLRGNKGVRLPKEIESLTNLEWLDLAGTDLTEVPAAVLKLGKLRNIDLSNNLITRLPKEIAELEELQILDVGSNPIEYPPLEALGISASGEVDIAKLRAFFRQAKGGMARLYEAKLLIVGEPGAGKTSLAKKLENPAYELRPAETTTRGVDVIHWEFPMASGEKFRVNIWDFAGQDIYKATHRFFLTKRSLYVLVADMRREDTDFYYWLSVVELFCDNSPVMIVKNRNQEWDREFDELALRGQFANLLPTRQTNLATKWKRDELDDDVMHQLMHLPFVGDELPETWVKVRDALEMDPRDYISREEYFEICRKNGFETDEDSRQLSGYLHDLGICLHFQDDPVLDQTVILKPKWGTDAVYRVLDNKELQDGTRVVDNGRFDRKGLASIWSDPAYKGKHYELLELMKKFRLCYQVRNTDYYIAPQLLPEKQPDYSSEWDTCNNLIFKYEYKPFMPKGILTQLIVEMHREIERQDWVWQCGVILRKDDTRGEVVEHYQAREIKIRLSGKRKRELLAIVCREIDIIHDTFRRLKPVKMVPCNCGACKGTQEPHFYPYDELLEFIDKGKPRQCGKSGEMVDPRELIDDVSNTDMHRMREGHMTEVHFHGNAQGVVIGDHGHQEGFTQNVQALTLDFAQLAAELERVREAARNQAETAEQFGAIVEIKKAEEAAARSDKPALMNSLKAGGNWVQEVAVKVGAATLAKLIEHSLTGG